MVRNESVFSLLRVYSRFNSKQALILIPDDMFSRRKAKGIVGEEVSGEAGSWSNGRNREEAKIIIPFWCSVVQGVEKARNGPCSSDISSNF